MPLLGDISVKIGADISGFQSGMKTVKGDLADTKGSAEETGGGFKSALGNIVSFAAGGAIIGGVTAAIGTLTGFVNDSVSAAGDMQKSQAQLNQVIKSTGDVSGVTADHANALADSLSNVTDYSSDTTRGAENMLLTFTNIGAGGGIFDRTTQTALDMSQALGQDTVSSAMQLGKALNDPIKGITALQRVGVTFTQTQKDLIAGYIKHGETAKAQSVILDELQKEFGGSAKAAGDTLAGKLGILGNKFTEVKEKVGNAFIPILNQAATAAGPLLDLVSNALPPAMDLVSKGIALVSGFIEDDLIPAFSHVGSSPLLGDLQDIASVIGADVQPIVTDLSTTFSSVLMPAIAGLLPHVENFGSILLGAAPIVLAVGMAVFGLATTIISNLLPILNVIIPIVAQFAGFLIDKLGAAIIFLEPYVLKAVTAITGFTAVLNEKAGPAVKVIGQVIQDEAKIISTVWNVLWPTISAVLAGAWSIMSGVVQVAWALITGIISVGLDLISGNWSGAWHDIQDTLAGVWGGIQSIIGGDVQIITGLVSGLVSGVSALISGVWGGLGSIVSGIFNGVRDSIMAPINEAKVLVSAGLNIISGLFSNMHLAFPHINLPHFNITGGFSLVPPGVPNFDVKWYAGGGVFNSPSVIGVGEAGPEAVIPLNRMPQAFGGGYQMANIYVMLDGYILMQALGQHLVDYLRLNGMKV